MDFDSLKDDSNAPIPSANTKNVSFDDLQDDSEKYGGVSGGLKAFGLGAGRSLSFGTLDQFLAKSGLMKPEDIAGYKRENPYWTGAGEIGGVLGAVVAPETGLLGAISAPVRAVSELGGAVTEAASPIAKGIAGAIASSESAPILNKVLSQAGAHLAGSVVEGAAYGLGQTVSEQALGDPDLNAQKVASNVINSALFGGALGAGFGAAEVAIPHSVSAAKGALDKLYDVSVGIPGEEPGILGKAYAHASSFVSGKPYDQIVDAMKDRMKSLVNPDEQKEVIESFSEGLKDQHAKVNKALFDANKNARLQETANYLKDVPGTAALPEMEKTVANLKNTIQDMRSEPDLYPGSYPRILEQITDRVSGEVGSESSAFDVFKSLNDLKGRLDEEIDYGAAPSGGDLRAQSKIAELRRGIKNSLEEPSIWGEAASRQAEFNDAQAQFFNLTGKKGLFRKNFMEQTVGKGGRLAYDVSPTKTETFLKQINTLRGDAKAQALKQYLDVSDNLVKQIEKTHQTLPDSSFNKEAVQSVIDKNKQLSQKAFDQAEFTKQLNALGAGAHNVPLAEGGALGAAVLGHPVLAGALETMSMLKAPGLGIQRLAKIERVVQQTSRAIGKGVSSIFKAGSKAAEPLIGLTATKLSQEEKHKKFDKIASQLNDLTNNPDKMMSTLENATSNLNEHAPQISQGLQMTMTRATQFLQSKIPGNGIPQRPLSSKYKPSDSELSKFNKYFNIVENPVDALREVASGTLSKETMEALSSVYPKLLSEMQVAVTDKMSEAISKKKSIPYQTKMSLSMFLGSDLVSSLDPVNMISNQNMLATATQAKNMQEMAQASSVNKKNVGKIEKSNRILTASQASAQREEV